MTTRTRTANDLGSDMKTYLGLDAPNASDASRERYTQTRTQVAREFARFDNSGRDFLVVMPREKLVTTIRGRRRSQTRTYTATFPDLLTILLESKLRTQTRTDTRSRAYL